LKDGNSVKKITIRGENRYGRCSQISAGT